MAFASGQTVTSAMLNRITRNDLLATQTSNVSPTTEVDIPGLTLSVTTPQANTKIKVTASLDLDVPSTDFVIVKLYVNGAAVSGDMNRGGGSARGPGSKTWMVNVVSASTFTVKLTAQKISGAGVSTIYGTHSTLAISGNGIS